MRNLSIAVAIATFNRSRLLGRAIRSVLDQTMPAAEILLVDDASTDDTAEYVRQNFPRARYFAQERNQGRGAARNRALQAARADYVLILDDDDTLLPNAIEVILSKIAALEHFEKYPVLNFAHGNGDLPEPWILARADDYIRGRLRGDFVPVIRRELFLERNLSYPPGRACGEHLLWWRIAEEWGIPSWAHRVGIVHSDAPLRLGSGRSQLAIAREHAELQERTIAEFGALLRERFPEYYRQRLLGAAAYRLLIGDRAESRAHLRALLRLQISKSAAVLWILTFVPRLVAKQCFLAYRRRCGAEG